MQRVMNTLFLIIILVTTVLGIASIVEVLDAEYQIESAKFEIEIEKYIGGQNGTNQLLQEGTNVPVQHGG